MTKDRDDAPNFTEYKREIYSLLDNVQGRLEKLEDRWIEHDREITRLTTKAGIIGAIAGGIIAVIGIIVNVILWAVSNGG